MRLNLAPVICPLLLALTSALPGRAQSPVVEYRAEAEEEERKRAEAERIQQLEAAYEARRARAHADLGQECQSCRPTIKLPGRTCP